MPANFPRKPKNLSVFRKNPVAKKKPFFSSLSFRIPVSKLIGASQERIFAFVQKFSDAQIEQVIQTYHALEAKGHDVPKESALFETIANSAIAVKMNREFQKRLPKK